VTAFINLKTRIDNNGLTIEILYVKYLQAVIKINYKLFLLSNTMQTNRDAAQGILSN